MLKILYYISSLALFPELQAHVSELPTIWISNRHLRFNVFKTELLIFLPNLFPLRSF